MTKEQEQTIKDFIDLARSENEKTFAATILELLAHEHRTHQQNFWRTIQQVMMGYADARHDARNEASVKWCRTATKDTGLPYI